MLLQILIIYLIFMNLLGLVIMGSDKYRAKKNRYRIPEKTLFLTSLLGGSVGTLAGMYLFRHKTRHWYFVVGMPCMLVLHILLACFIVRCIFHT